jgi:hypothetical protein
MRDAKSVDSEVPSVVPVPRAVVLSVCWSIREIMIRRTRLSLLVSRRRAPVTVLSIVAITIGIGVGSLVLEHLEKAIKQDGEKGAKKWTHPIDPVVVVEAT